MKKEFKDPTILITEFTAEHIVTASGDNGTNTTNSEQAEKQLTNADFVTKIHLAF